MIRFLVIVRFVRVASWVKKREKKSRQLILEDLYFSRRLLEFLLIIVTRGKFVVAKNGLSLTLIGKLFQVMLLFI